MNEMPGSEIWHRAPDGHLFAAVHSLRLIVRISGGYTRYLILERGAHGKKGRDTMLASGTEANVNAAMIAARRAAMRISAMLDERKKQRLLAGVAAL
jgi:hypothetical protein